MDNFALLSMGSSNVPEYSGLKSHIYIVNYTFIRKYRQCPKRCKSYEVTEEKANFWTSCSIWKNVQHKFSFAVRTVPNDEINFPDWAATKVRWLMLAPTRMTEQEEESGEDGSAHQTCAEQIQIYVGEHQGISPSTKS